MITIKARFDGRVFVPEEPVSLPVGFLLEIPVHPQGEVNGTNSTLQDLAALAKELPENPDWPPDGAAQLDHYLYGTPKKP